MKKVILVFIVILIGIVIVLQDDGIRKKVLVVTKTQEIEKKHNSAKIIDDILTMDDIALMRKVGVLISFNKDEKLKKISSEITPNKLLEVYAIDFNNSKMYILPNWLSRMKNLHVLNLNNTGITAEDLDKISSLTKLEVLNIANNHIMNENDKQTKGGKSNLWKLSKLVNLKKLYLKEYYGSDFLIELNSQFPNLEILDLQKKDIDEMRKKGVLISFVSDKKLKKIPLNITIEKFMQIDGINFNKIKLSYQFPNWLGRMKNLTTLNLNSTKINSDDIEKVSLLTKINILNLRNNELDSFPIYHRISSMRLIELDLSNTHRYSSKSLYSDIGNLTSLKKLSLSNNSLDFEKLGLEKLKNLKTLNLSNCYLGYQFDTKFLPKKSLRELYIKNSYIDNFSFNGDFPLLEVLDISKNNRSLKINEKYGSFLHLKNLKQLKVDDDAIIPDSLKKKISKLKSK